MSDIKVAAYPVKRGLMFKCGVLVGVLGVLAFAKPGYSAVNAVAGLANPMENIGTGARAMGMGSAYVGVADDATALLWNPAGLADLKNTELEWDSNLWLAGIVQETALLGLPLGSLGGLGASINYINFGTLAGYDANGNQTGNYSANEYGFDLGWGMDVLSGLSCGVTLKGNMQSIGSTNYSDLAVDLGALWSPFPDLRVGLAYTNLGTTINGYAEDSGLRPGLSYCLHLSDDNQLLLAGSAAWEPLGVSSLQAGAEDRIYQLLSLRIGYEHDLADTQIQGVSGLTAGLGVLVAGINLDYAYLPFGDLGAVNWITLGYKFE